MLGKDQKQTYIWSTIQPEERVPQDHPLRPIREMVNQALKELSGEFRKLYAKRGRPSIPPERLLRALLLQALYSIRSERQLMEQLNYNILFRWFVGLSMDEPVWDASSFSQNRGRLLDGEIAERFLREVLVQAKTQGLLSAEHFTVDGTMIEAWASHKSFKQKDTPTEAPEDPDDPCNPTVDFRGEQWRNDAHASTTDPQARLFRKGPGREARLCYLGHILMENRNGLAVNAYVTLANGYAEREAALQMVREVEGNQRITVGADKGYDSPDFVFELREQNATPHIAQNNTRRKSNIDERTTRHPGYQISQVKRKRVEEIFGWLKSVALLARVKYRGRERVRWMFTLGVAAYNLVRMRNLQAGNATT